MNSGPTPPQPCPECGLDPRTPGPATPRTWSILLWQAGLLLAALSWLAWMNWKSWPVLPPPRPYAAETISSINFPHERYSREDVARIARGESGPTDFLRDMDASPADPLSGFIELTAGFVPPNGQITSVKRLGWPVPLITRRSDTTSEDVYGRAPASQTPERTTSGWIEHTHFTRTFYARGVDTRMVTPAAIGGIVLLAALAFRAALLLRATLLRTRPRHGNTLLVRSIPAAALLLTIAGVGALSFPPERVEALRPASRRLHSSPTGILASEAPGHNQAAQQRLAAAILAVTDDGAEGVLAIGCRPRSSFTVTSGRGGFPRVNISRQTVERGLSGPRFSIKSDGSSAILVHRRFETARTTVTQYGLPLQYLANTLLALLLVWYLPRIARWARTIHRGRRSRRRAKANHCIHCGYDLA